MFTHSTMLVCALGFAGTVGSAVATAAPALADGGGFTSVNKLDIQVVSCVGSISVIPVINVDVKDIRALNNNEMNVLKVRAAPPRARAAPPRAIPPCSAPA